MKEKPAAKVCVLYQNDDFGKDYLIGLHEGFGDQFDKIVIKSVSYEVTDPTVDSQVVTLQAAGCDTLLTAATPKFAARRDPQGVRHRLEAAPPHVQRRDVDHGRAEAGGPRQEHGHHHRAATSRTHRSRDGRRSRH